MKLLESNGNWATDWSVVRISSGVAGRFQVDRVRGNCFHGPVLLGDLAGEVKLLMVLVLMVVVIIINCTRPVDEQNTQPPPSLLFNTSGAFMTWRFDEYFMYCRCEATRHVLSA